jgi:hypothetical protein
MKPGTDYKPSTSIAILCVGEPGTGHTRLMSAFPDPGIVDLDLNLNSAIPFLKGKKWCYAQPGFEADGKRIEPIDFGKEAFRSTPSRWENTVAETKKLLASPDVRTICVDGLGILVEYLMEHIINEGRKAGTNKSGKMEIQSYAELARLLRGYIAMIRSVGKIVYVTAHQTSDKDDVTGAIRYVLAVPGQSKDTLMALFTDVLATAARPDASSPVGAQYEIITRPSGFHIALKCSVGLPPRINVTNKTPDEVWKIFGPAYGLA